MTNSLIDMVTDRFPDAVSASHAFRGDETVVLCPEFLHYLVTLLYHL